MKALLVLAAIVALIVFVGQNTIQLVMYAAKEPPSTGATPAIEQIKMAPLYVATALLVLVVIW